MLPGGTITSSFHFIIFLDVSSKGHSWEIFLRKKKIYKLFKLATSIYMSEAGVALSVV